MLYGAIHAGNGKAVQAHQMAAGVEAMMAAQAGLCSLTLHWMSCAKKLWSACIANDTAIGR